MGPNIKTTKLSEEKKRKKTKTNINIYSLKISKNDNKYHCLLTISNWVSLWHNYNIQIFAMNDVICYNWSSS